MEFLGWFLSEGYALIGRRTEAVRWLREAVGQGLINYPLISSDPFLESLMDTSLYSMGAYFSDQHPDLVDDVIAQADAIAAGGLRSYAADNDMPLEACFETLLTGLAVRYYNAIAG